MTNKIDWKHGSFFAPNSEPEAVVVFDDEGYDDLKVDTLYYKYPEGLCPLRSVDTTDRKRWADILGAWSMRAPLEDKRINQSISLPTHKIRG